MYEEPPEQTRKMRRIAALVTAAIFGALLSAGGLIVVAVLQDQRSLPPMSPQDFYQAKQRWEARGPANYNLEVSVSGRQAATYYVEVRDGDVSTATRDGKALTRRRTLGTWSVSGMFATIESDVINVKRHREGTADRQTPQLRLRALFDERLGYPKRYHRNELRKWGPNQEVMWEVTRFESVE